MAGTEKTSKTRETTGSDGWRDARRRWVFNTGKRLRKRLTGFLARQSTVGDPVIFDNADFPWTAEFAREWKTVRGELDALLEHRRDLPPFQMISRDQGGIAKEDKWKVFLLFGMGQKSERNCALCPETVKLLERVPKLTSAWFSILAPRYHVPKHRGITKGMIRCHVGIVVPDDRERCRMQIGPEQTIVWEEGGVVLFDDMRKHEVWNDTDQERVVLLFDFERPMRPMGRMASRMFNAVLKRTAYFKDARKNQLEWERRFHDELDRARTGAAASG